MGTGTTILIIIVAAILAAVGIYNGLLAKKVASENAWAQIDVQLKRRHDLVPNLVETVKGYAKHEREALERVIQARNAAVQIGSNVKELAQAENALSGALRQLFALSEAYPDLKANTNFLQLQEELMATENRIGFSRQHYNDTVAIYNLAIQKIPANIIAAFCNFKERDYFQMDAEEAKLAQKPPQVAF